MKLWLSFMFWVNLIKVDWLNAFKVLTSFLSRMNRPRYMYVSLAIFRLGWNLKRGGAHCAYPFCYLPVDCKDIQFLPIVLVTPRLHRCEHCSRIFSTLHAYTRHKRTCNTHECPICHRGFSQVGFYQIYLLRYPILYFWCYTICSFSK